MANHLAITELVGRILNEAESLFAALLGVEVTSKLVGGLAFFSIHFVLEVAKELLESVDAVAKRNVVYVKRGFKDCGFVRF